MRKSSLGGEGEFQGPTGFVQKSRALAGGVCIEPRPQVTHPVCCLWPHRLPPSQASPSESWVPPIRLSMLPPPRGGPAVEGRQACGFCPNVGVQSGGGLSSRGAGRGGCAGPSVALSPPALGAGIPAASSPLPPVGMFSRKPQDLGIHVPGMPRPGG